MHQLSSFSSVFELAVAICLAYGLVRAIFESPLKEVERKIKGAKHILTKYSSEENGEYKKLILDLEHIYFIHQPQLIHSYKVLAQLSLFCGLIPLGILIFSGFSSVYPFELYQINIFLIISFMPVPILGFIAHYISKRTVNKFATLFQELDEMKNIEVRNHLLRIVYS